MLNTGLQRTVLLLFVARIIFSIPVHEHHSDEIISTSGITHSFPGLEDNISNEGPSTSKITYASLEVEDPSAGIIFPFRTMNVPVNDSDEIISTARITHASPEAEDHSFESARIFNVTNDFTTELQNALVCESEQWADCESFLEEHLDKDSKEYKQLQHIRRQRGHFTVPELAALMGHTDLIQVLLRNGVPINRRYDDFGRTMLHKAAQGEKDDVVALLLTHGADTEITDRFFGNTPLHEALIRSSSTTKLLLDAGANVNAINKMKETALVMAVKYYFTPLTSLQYAKGKEIIELLLEHGANTNIPDKEGNTPLHITAKVCNATIAKLLIDRGANINATNFNNQTPLHKATESNNVSVVEYLVAMGCDKTIIDAEKKMTALSIAIEMDYNEIIDLLYTKSY